MAVKYSFSNLCSPATLPAEIVAAGILETLDHIDVQSEPKNTDIWFANPLSVEDEVKLGSIFSNHAKIASKVSLTGESNAAINQADTDGAMIVRSKAAKKGWSFWALPPEITTSRLSGDLYCKDANGVDIPGVTCKIYNISDVEITTGGLAGINLTTCVKTVLDIECPFDVELIGGSLRINSNPAQDLRVWIVGAPDIPAPLGSKEFASGINLKFLAPDNSFDIDGRVTKYVTFNSTLHTGKIRIIFKHGAGLTVNLQCLIHLYRL